MAAHPLLSGGQHFPNSNPLQRVFFLANAPATSVTPFSYRGITEWGLDTTKIAYIIHFIFIVVSFSRQGLVLKANTGIVANTIL